jgi:hypothetical protein
MYNYFIYNSETKTWTQTDEATYVSFKGKKLQS